MTIEITRPLLTLADKHTTPLMALLALGIWLR